MRRFGSSGMSGASSYALELLTGLAGRGSPCARSSPATSKHGGRCASGRTTGCSSGSRSPYPASPTPPTTAGSSPPGCGARDRERQLGSGYGFGIFVGSGFAGEINVSSIQRGPFQNAYVGYWIDQATPATATSRRRSVLVFRFGFEELALHRLQIAIIPRNAPQPPGGREARLRNEGTAVRYLEINGSWEDHVRYAITAEEWWDKREVYAREWLTPLA